MRLVTGFFPLCVVAAVSLSCSDTLTPVPLKDRACFDKPGGSTARPTTTPVGIACVIQLPGNPILSGTKSWVDPTTKLFYETDVSNAAVDMIDLKGDTFVARVTGFVGATGVAATSGPNSIVFPGNGTAWVSDGNSNVRVVNLATRTFTTNINTAIAACDDGGTNHFCQRTNEISYDPEDQIIVVQNPSPLAVAATGTPPVHAPIDTYMTFISAVSYQILGTLSFPGAGGQEAPLWNPTMHRLLSAVSGTLNGAGTAVTNPQYVAVINPLTRLIERKDTLDCLKLTNTIALGINDPSLGPNHNMIIPGCGKAIIYNPETGTGITVIQPAAGGNETWYNSGDGRFYTTGVDATGVNSLDVIDATTNTFLQSVPAVGATNPTADAVTNQIFAVVQVTAAQVAAPATDNTACSVVGITGTGCIVVFAHGLQ